MPALPVRPGTHCVPPSTGAASITGPANKPPMLVKEFAEAVQQLSTEIGCDGGGQIRAHAVPSLLTAVFRWQGEFITFDVQDVDGHTADGCGCRDGIVLRLVANDPGTLEALRLAAQRVPPHEALPVDREPARNARDQGR